MREATIEELVERIEKLQAMDTALRCMQQILKSNGSMTYHEFQTNLAACGIDETDLGEG